MIRRRLYNPAQLTPEELKASFVARQETLADMLHLLGEQKSGRPCQHILIVGPRGMGKTTLGLRFLQAVYDTPGLATRWQPVAFHEESYDIGDLSDFWLAALRHLTRATKEPRWADRAEALAKDEKDTERLAAYALATLLDFRQTSGKRLILFVENLDLVFDQLRDERDVHALRASLIEHSDILLIGSANAVFDAIRNHGKPFYEFFRLFILRGLGREECLRILEALAEHEGRKQFPEILNRERGRLETVRRLTGGNPRLLVLACRMLIESPLGSAFEDLERLIDEQTPYFKARIEELPVQARKVFHCLAEMWTPRLARELSVAAKLSSSHASAQLRQLVEKGYAKEVRIPREKRVRYEVSDRFYNIYYLLRFSRTGRDRLERLVGFLHDLFGSTGMRSMYPATLEALRARALPVVEMSDWLGVLASYVAGDWEFAERENWRRQATDLAKDMIGIDAPVLGEIQQAFVSQRLLHSTQFLDSMRRSVELFQAERFADAEAICREVIKETPENAAAWLILGSVLLQQKRFEDALNALRRTAEYVSPDDPAELRMIAIGGLAGESIASIELEQLETSISAIERSTEYLRPEDPFQIRDLVAGGFRYHGDALARMGHQEEAIAVWQRVAEYVRPVDPHTLRRQAARALNGMGDAFTDLGRHAEALSTWERITGYVNVEDPGEVRHLAAIALVRTGTTLSELRRPEEAITVWRLSSDYVRIDDPIELRRPIAALLANVGKLSNALGKYDEAEFVCRKAMDFEPAHGEAWHFLARAILGQNDDARLTEAETYARRAVQLEPEDANALHTLSDVLAHDGNWSEALELLERALRTEDVRKEGEWPGVATSLIRLVAAGYGSSVRRLMDTTGLTEIMEPLWHAVRADLGEELEPLPAEIMDTVTDVRQKFADERQ